MNLIEYKFRIGHMWGLYESTLAYAESGIALGVGVDETLVNAVIQISPRIIRWSETGGALVNTDQDTAQWQEVGATIARDLAETVEDTPGAVLMEAAQEELIETSGEIRAVLSSNLLWLAIGAVLVIGGYLYVTRGGAS